MPVANSIVAGVSYSGAKSPFAFPYFAAPAVFSVPIGGVDWRAARIAK